MSSVSNPAASARRAFSRHSAAVAAPPIETPKRNGRTAADDFPERRQIRFDAEALLSSAERDAESGHDFVENQERAVPRREFA